MLARLLNRHSHQLVLIAGRATKDRADEPIIKARVGDDSDAIKTVKTHWPQRGQTDRHFP